MVIYKVIDSMRQMCGLCPVLILSREVPFFVLCSLTCDGGRERGECVRDVHF